MAKTYLIAYVVGSDPTVHNHTIRKEAFTENVLNDFKGAMRYRHKDRSVEGDQFIHINIVNVIRLDD